MPKIKTNRSVKKRFKITKNGKIKRKNMNTRHILQKKSSKRKRRLRGLNLVHESNKKGIVKMIPYGGN